MALRLRLAPMVAIALFLASSGFGGPGSRAFVASATPAKPGTPAPAVSEASASAVASHDPNYYAYATRYYLQYLSSREQAETNAKDPYYFFNYYQFYRERYAPGSASKDPASAVPAWFATMPFRNARTQSFARFVQVASPSAAPSPRWVQPLRDFQRTAGR
ncbi:hypothetical protein D3C87_680460 [compost metagenome]